MKNKDIIIGIVTGIITTIIGSILYLTFFSKFDLVTSIKQVMRFNSFNKLVNLGALLNLAAFYFFLHKDQELRAKGVLIITIILAFVFLIQKLF
ncbi:hypothetical protein [Aurantibacter sp.]|uniref:hypothetical protein n=1 Tax=Aurantibacter sp. TaxID=2807103 RepID=UPI0035C842F6